MDEQYVCRSPDIAEAMRKAFAEHGRYINLQVVSVPPRNNTDVQDFLQKYHVAQEASKDSTLQFDYRVN